MKSMTGYGYHEYRDERMQLSVELKSYNNRYLELSCNMPSFLGPLEPRVRAYLGERLNRGKVEISIRVKEFEVDAEVRLDRSSTLAYTKALDELRAVAGIEEPIGLSHLLRFDDVVKVDRSRDAESYWSIVSESLEAAYAAFDETRRTEGDATRADLSRSTERLAEDVEAIAGYAGSLEERIQQNILERFQTLLGNDYDESRAYAEVAVLLSKYSINEEIERARAHVERLREAMDGADAVGKRIDFVCQELNREVNTIGSKNMIQEVSELVIDAKDAVENIREQARNVE
jgi:uncharacterized protein (TIGR00255 family)